MIFYDRLAFIFATSSILPEVIVVTKISSHIFKKIFWNHHYNLSVTRCHLLYSSSLSTEMDIVFYERLFQKGTSP